MTSSCSLYKAVGLCAASAILMVLDRAALYFSLYGPLSGLVVQALALGLVCGVALYLSRIGGVIERISKVCGAAARGDLEARVQDDPEPGLIGCLQRNVNHLLDISDAFVREASGSMAAVAQGKYYRKVVLRGLPGSYANAARTLNRATETMEVRVNDFARFASDNVTAVMTNVANAAADMKASAEVMSGAATEGNRLAASVAASAEQVTANVQSVAAAAEELAGSVSAIAHQAAQSTQIAQSAAQEAAKTNAIVESLAEAANRIGDIVQIITSIAGQTNLLALNATIEAARAGEAGKGFQIVASEVKALAAHTAKATEEITTQIGAIQATTQVAASAIENIGRTIHEIHQLAASISSAVEEQGNTTQEIARGVSEAAAGTSEVSLSITGVSRSAGQTGLAADEVLNAASGLSRQAERLRAQIEAEVDQFLGRSLAA